ncbi:MAG TPA: ABC transporter permease [Cyclobacteriaceae bacterium]|jgi:putative ABC transport system permease protein|nr:ABC transporter permease [Cyclobacteriaceae bacterium]
MKEKEPPRLAVKFLHWFCPPELAEGIEGDLVEQFEGDLQQMNERAAKRKFFWNTLNFFRPAIILRNRFRFQLIENFMIGNYFKVALRNMKKRKLYSFINAFGLSVGIAFCVLIYLFIQDERSFDQFHGNKNLIYRMEARTFDTWKPKAEEPFSQHAWLQTALVNALKDDLAEVEYASRFNSNGDAVFKFDDKVFTEQISYVDPDFFKMFSFRLLKGNVNALFKKRSDMVITPAVAKKYFGDEDPVGKIVTVDVEGVKTFSIAGVIEAPPTNSSLDFRILVSQENRPYYENNLKQWGNFNTPTFVQLVPHTDFGKLNANLDKLITKYMGEKLEKWKKESAIPVPPGVKMLEYKYTQLPEMHLKKEITWHKVSDPKYSYILGSIAILILIIACINYVSLALTTSASRKTEVGIRKVVGAHRNQLIYQFGFESLLLAALAMVAAFGLVALFLPSFNEFTGKGIELHVKNLGPVMAASAAITLFVGIVAGSYPSLFLSNFRPAAVLKGNFTSKFQAGFVRPLVVVQFFLSASLIISSVIMYRQMNFIATKNLGYNQNQVLVVPTQRGWNKESNKAVAQFRNALMQEPEVQTVAGTSTSFNRGYSRYGYKIDGEQRSAYVYAVDPYYLQALEIQLTQGRNFSEQIPADSNAVIVNEALVKDMKWTDPLNAYLNWKEDTVGMGARVIGVVKDYNFTSLESNVEPLFLSMDKKDIGYLTNMMIKINSQDIPNLIEKIRGHWKQLYPDLPFDYTFLDEDVAKQYHAYEKWMSIMGLSTGFAIMISCLGLFGLAGINSVNRTKEIGIRKVMGAGLRSIFVLLNKQFVWLALIAFSLATPLSWYLMNNWWLKDFKYQVTIGWELFVGSMLCGLVVALLTVSYHAIKTALVNPADTLKYE